MGSLRRLVIVSLASLAACGGASARSFDGSVYRDGAIAFQLGPTPPSWRRVSVDGAAIAWRDDADGASILVNARCGRDDQTPLAALTNHLLMGSTEREVVAQATIPFDRREALHTTMTAKWDGVPMALDIFVTKKDGCVYDFVYVAPQGSFASGSPGFEQFVGGFHTLEGSGVVLVTPAPPRAMDRAWRRA